MTRVGSSGRLGELLRIVGTQPTGKKASGRKTTGKPSPPPAKSLDTLRQELATEIAAIDFADPLGRETAQRLLIHRVILARLGGIEPSAAQLSFLTREVSEKAAQRPEVRELLDAVIDEILAE